VDGAAYPPKTVQWVVEPPFSVTPVDDALEPFEINMPQGVTRRVEVVGADPSSGVGSFTVTVVAELSTITPEVSLVPGAPVRLPFRVRTSVCSTQGCWGACCGTGLGSASAGYAKKRPV
jgi:hypothetical protein